MDEREIVAKLRKVLESEERAMERDDWVAYEALCREETRLMDILHVHWAAQKEAT